MLFWFHVDSWILTFGSTLSAFGVPFAPSIASCVPCIPQDLHCRVKIVFSELSLTKKAIKILLHNCSDNRNIFLNLISLLRWLWLGSYATHTHTYSSFQDLCWITSRRATLEITVPILHPWQIIEHKFHSVTQRTAHTQDHWGVLNLHLWWWNKGVNAAFQSIGLLTFSSTTRWSPSPPAGKT